MTRFSGSVAIGASVVSMLIGASAAQATFPGENGRIAFGCGGDICTVNADGGGRKRLTHNPKFEALPAFSANGRRIAFERLMERVQSAIVLMRANGTHLKRITSPGAAQPGFSPDGTKIVFVDTRRARQGITVMNIDGSHRTLLLPDRSAIEPSFSPDGSRILFIAPNGTSPGPHHFAAFTMAVDGSDLQRVTPHNATDTIYSASWAPDGDRILLDRWGPYAGHPDQFFHGLYTIESDGSNLTLIEPSPTPDGEQAAEFEPVFSPDGQRIEFLWADQYVGSMDDYATHMFTMQAGGGSARSTGVYAGYDSYPDWGPKVVQ